MSERMEFYLYLVSLMALLVATIWVNNSVWYEGAPLIVKAVVVFSLSVGLFWTTLNTFLRA